MPNPLSAQDAAALGLEEETSAPRALAADQAQALGLEAAPGPGQGETFGRHLAQGATLNFADEIGAFFKAVGPDQKGYNLGNAYRIFRDQWRERDRAGAHEYPKTAIAGNVLGSAALQAVPVVGAVSRVPGVGGALSGLGASEADVTRGDWMGAVRDASIGAGTDLATAGAFKLGGKAISLAARGAPARQEARAVKELLTGVPAKVQDENLARIGGKEAIVEVLERHGLRKVLSNPAKLDDAIQARELELGKTLGEWYKAADGAAPSGIPMAKIEQALNTVKAQAKARGDHRAMAAVDAEIAGLKSIYADEGAMTAQQLHGKVREFGNRGYGTSFLDPSAASSLRRDMNSATREVLQQHVDDVAKAYPRIGDRAALQRANKEFSELSAVGDMVEAKAKRLQREAPGLGQRIQEGVRAASDVAAIGGVLSGQPLMTALPVAARVAPRLPGLADAGLIRLAQAARSGMDRPSLMALAVKQGIPRAIAAQIIADEEQAAAAAAVGPPQ